MPAQTSETDAHPAGQAPRTAAGIAITDLAMAFRPDVPVLQDLTLNVQPGEIIALVGPSGCGKSTLLRLIAQLLQPSQGTIELHSGSPSRRRGDLAFVFQEATLLPWRTAAENVRLPLELGLRGVPAADRRPLVQQALHSVGLDDRASGLFPRELSGGMRMRASIARALVTDPNVLLLDEPFAALDDLLRCRLNDLLLELWMERRRTIVFVTHNIAEAIYLSHRVVVLAGGRVACIIDNPLDWPRAGEQRSSTRFAEFYGQVSGALAESVA